MLFIVAVVPSKCVGARSGCRYLWLTTWLTPLIPRLTRLQKPSMVLV